tara:strand:+ start:12 stop:518 length:507 start_codon:yes stop_codon:yes gene_type:complete
MAEQQKTLDNCWITIFLELDSSKMLRCLNSFLCFFEFHTSKEDCEIAGENWKNFVNENEYDKSVYEDWYDFRANRIRSFEVLNINDLATEQKYAIEKEEILLGMWISVHACGKTSCFRNPAIYHYLLNDESEMQHYIEKNNLDSEDDDYTKKAHFLKLNLKVRTLEIE